MDRRNFLQGAFGGIVSSGLIITASTEEVLAFASPLKKNDPVGIKKQGEDRGFPYVYDVLGNCIGTVSSFRNQTEPVEISGLIEPTEKFYVYLYQ